MVAAIAHIWRMFRFLLVVCGEAGADAAAGKPGANLEDVALGAAKEHDAFGDDVGAQVLSRQLAAARAVHLAAFRRQEQMLRRRAERLKQAEHDVQATRQKTEGLLRQTELDLCVARRAVPCRAPRMLPPSPPSPSPPPFPISPSPPFPDGATSRSRAS